MAALVPSLAALKESIRRGQVRRARGLCELNTASIPELLKRALHLFSRRDGRYWLTGPGIEFPSSGGQSHECFGAGATSRPSTARRSGGSSLERVPKTVEPQSSRTCATPSPQAVTRVTNRDGHASPARGGSEEEGSPAWALAVRPPVLRVERSEESGVGRAQGHTGVGRHVRIPASTRTRLSHPSWRKLRPSSRSTRSWLRRRLGRSRASNRATLSGLQQR